VSWGGDALPVRQRVGVRIRRSTRYGTRRHVTKEGATETQAPVRVCPGPGCSSCRHQRPGGPAQWAGQTGV